MAEERREVVPRENGGFLPVLTGGAAMDEPRGERWFGELGAPVIEAREEVGGDGFTGLDFDGLEGVGAGCDESVDFVAFLVAEEMK